MSSPKLIEKVSSDNIVVSFDLVSHLTYMAVLSMGGLPREQILLRCGQLRLRTSVFFEYIYMMAKRMGVEYTQAFQMVSQKARATSIKSLLLRFAASISSGESETSFVAQEAKTETERYTHEYERSVENLRKWTDAYAAMMFSVTLIMVVSLVSTMIGFFDESVIMAMAATVMILMVLAVYVILKVAPVEEITYESANAVPRNRRLAPAFSSHPGPRWSGRRNDYCDRSRPAAEFHSSGVRCGPGPGGFLYSDGHSCMEG